MYGRRKKFDKRYLLILVIVAIALILVILAISLKKDRDLNPVEKVLKDAGATVVKVVSSPFDLIKNKLSENKEKDDLYNKYKKLKKKTDEIEAEKASNKNLTSEVNKLKETLNLNTLLSDKVLVNATVIFRNVGYWYDEITIDKGSADGVEKDMAVVVPKGLIGKTTKVSTHTSTVKLLSTENMDNKISVKIKTDNDYVYGLIYKYDSKNNTYMVEGINQAVNIPENADVVTTGMGAIFPSGLLVGKVSKMTNDNFDLSKVVEVNTLVDFNELEYVTVLKRK